ncbi:MAG TPA: hypothetical protein VGK49_09545 [Ilumatobacteraceae bacterium]
MHEPQPDQTPAPDGDDDVAGHLYIPPGERSGTAPDSQEHGGPTAPATKRADA